MLKRCQQDNLAFLRHYLTPSLPWAGAGTGSIHFSKFIFRHKSFWLLWDQGLFQSSLFSRAALFCCNV